MNGDPQSGKTINLSAFVVPGIGDAGPYPRFYLRNPGIRNQDLSIFKSFPMGGEGRRYLQLRMEAFNILNHPQFSGYNLTTNVINGAGQSGNAIFGAYQQSGGNQQLAPGRNASVWELTSGSTTPRAISASSRWPLSSISDCPRGSMLR